MCVAEKQIKIRKEMNSDFTIGKRSTYLLAKERM